MKYEDALEKILNENSYDFYENSFLLMSLISDEIGNDFQSKIILKSLYKIIIVEDVFDLIRTHDLVTSRKLLEESYVNNFKGTLTSKEFVNALNPVCKFYHPDEFTSASKNKKNVAKKDESNEKIINRAPIQKPKSVVINNVNINFSGGLLNVEYTDGTKPEIYINGKLDKTAIQPTMIKNDTLYLLLRKRTSKVVVKLPKKKYNEIKIFTNNDVHLDNDLVISKANIFSIGGKITCFSKCDEINIDTNTSCYFCSEFKDINIKSSGGFTYVYLYELISHTTNINIESEEDILIELLNMKLNRQITPLLRTVRNVDTFTYIDNHEVNFKLRTKIGKIKVKKV